jgi:LemA protein
MQNLIIGIVVVVIVLLVAAIVLYNSLIALKNNREQAFSDIDVQLKLRYDLVPNLVNAIEGYATHEKDTFENVAKLRTLAMGAQGIDNKIQAENQFAGAVKSLFAVAEGYPELKANQNFLQLQTELADIENKIAAARRFFNSATKEFNTVLLSFPTNLLNSLFRFQQGTFFDIGSNAEVERENVTVNLDK